MIVLEAMDQDGPSSAELGESLIRPGTGTDTSEVGDAGLQVRRGLHSPSR